MMNCRKGDLAVIIIGGNAGAFVNVIDRAPEQDFFLPSMTYSEGAPEAWIIQAIGPGLTVGVQGGGERQEMYAMCLDAYLRPIRGLPPVVVSEQELAEALGQYMEANEPAV